MCQLPLFSFYRGKAKEGVLNADKNVLTDVVVPILSIVIVIFLLIEYNWKAQFGVANNAGQIVGVNWYAIAMMIFGFVILPLIMAWISRSERKN